MNHQTDREESRTYIKPTGPGVTLMMMLAAMLLASVNYGNNMAYILCFLLTGLMMTAYLSTRNNLKGLDIGNVQSQPVFAGEILHINFELHNQTRGRRVAVFPLDYSTGTTDNEGYSGPFTVDKYSRTSAEMSIPVPNRGRFILSHITLLSVYPLGLFQAQRHIPVDKVYIVYPKPVGDRGWPEPELHDADSSEGYFKRGGDDFVGVRPYREGESMHHIDWKAYARGRPLSVKEFTGGGTTQMWFDWTNLHGIGTEARLSQLARWVLEADQGSTEFGLRLPNKEVPVDCSPGHTVNCLESLAVFQYGEGETGN
ncbi:MAG: DUF58 domain-containing protein [bacterium]|nr:DUF58 domain-containing protein [bacterium]